MKHLIDPTDLTVEETRDIINLALDIIANREKYSERCKGKNSPPFFMNLRQEHVSVSQLP